MTIEDKLREKREQEESVGEAPRIDPKSVKLVGVNNELTENDLITLME